MNEKQMWRGKPDNTRRDDAEKRPTNRADRRERRILIAFIAAAVLCVTVWAIVVGTKVGFGRGRERTNPQQSGTARVYDYADMLTDSQEQQLEEQIGEAEQKIRADIVIVIIDESLEEKYPDLHYYSWDETDAYTGIRRYAESFWTEKGFGWNKAGDEGNGIIMVDNIYRESNGYVYNWVAGAGDLRYSVGNTDCQKLSQRFTDRLPMGDMPKYSQEYADALMSFVTDCVKTGSRIHKILSWSAFTPAGVIAAMTSSAMAFIAGAAVLSVLMGRMLWQMNYSGKQRSAKKKEGKGWTVLWVLIWIGIILLMVAFPQVFGVAFIILFFGILFISIFGSALGLDKKDKKQKKREPQKEAPFRIKEPIEPDQFTVTGNQDQYMGSYFVSNASGGGGGHSSGGGGGHSSGGGGGFSGGGSHR